MTLGIHKALMLMLPAEIDEVAAHFCQAAGGCERAINVCARAAAFVNDTTNEQLVFALFTEWQSALSQNLPNRASNPLGDFEDGFDNRLLRTGSGDVGTCTATAEQIHRLDNEGLSRSGFAG